MPLEGHYARQTTPLYKLSSREIKIASITLVVTIAAMLAVVIATVGDSNPPTPKRKRSAPTQPASTRRKRTRS
jgi:hypothetical protein